VSEAGRKKPGPKPRTGCAAVMIPVRVDPGLVAAIQSQADPRGFLEEAIRVAIDRREITSEPPD